MELSYAGEDTGIMITMTPRSAIQLNEDVVILRCPQATGNSGEIATILAATSLSESRNENDGITQVQLEKASEYIDTLLPTPDRGNGEAIYAHTDNCNIVILEHADEDRSNCHIAIHS